MQFEIPPYLAEKIAENPEISSAIGHALTELFPWFLDNKLFFFPEFTDHGVDHINSVLKTAESLISTEARQIFTAHDAGATIAAVLLHDCAMHLSWEGFQTLLSGNYVITSPLLPDDMPTWPEVFKSFMHQAFRWDQKKLLEVIGAVKPIRFPPENFIDVTEIDRRVIGEFVRIHHSRIAHEIAHLGVPGPIEKRANWLHPLRGEALPADLVGLIARSHNLSIRKAKNLLPKHRRTEFKGIHAPFVMALLRIADYLQIQSKRAHPSLLSIRRVSSTISVMEWNKHAATVDIHPHGDDPEALVVHTEPADVSTLFALRGLFKSMQQELDETWACLGEVYGRHVAFEPFAFKGLAIRRLQTNIDDLRAFRLEEKPKFIPIEMHLRSAGADMFGLLVGPLYDGEPSIAIRELVQNAVDACNERAALEVSLTESATVGTVIVELNIESEESGYLQISDTGIGMTLDTVRDYFLVAGASFRKSGWWKEHFAGDDGKSRINRSGRFGVGALASFLVGPRTSVTTRHINEPMGLGISFSYGIDDYLVEAKFVPAEIGTTIRIEIKSAEILKRLQSFENPETYGKEKSRVHWYGLATPSVSCFITTKKNQREILRTFSVPTHGETIPNDWHELNHPNFNIIHWSFKGIRSDTDYYPRNWLLCNGILVDKNWASRVAIGISPLSPTVRLETPCLSVFDPDGFLPLNLARDHLADHTVPFHKELQLSMADWFVSAANEAWNNAPTIEKAIKAIERLDGISSQSTYYSTTVGLFAYSRLGVCFLDSHLLSQVGFDRLLLIPQSQAIANQKELVGYLAIGSSGLIHREGDFEKKSDIESSFRSLLNPEAGDRKFFDSLGRSVKEIRICCSKQLLSIAREKGRIPNYMFSAWTFEQIDDERVILKWGDSDNQDVANSINMSNLITGKTIFAEITFGSEITPVHLSPLAEQWQASGATSPFFNKTETS